LTSFSFLILPASALVEATTDTPAVEPVEEPKV